MAEDIIFPRVDMDMTSGQISRWFFKDGERVEKGQPLFEIETDKAAMEIDASVAGILRAPAATGQQVNVGSVVGYIVQPDENFIVPENPKPDFGTDVKAEISNAASASSHTTSVSSTHMLAEPRPTQTHENGVRATPLARQLARSHSLDIELITGSGPNGRIQAHDIDGVIENKMGKREQGRPVSSSAFSTHLEESSAPLNGVFLREGQGDPLVLIHGFGADLNSWRPLVQSMDQGQKIFAIDLPGHGQSPWQGATSMNAVVDSVAQRIEAAGFANFHLIGHSLGAAIATLLAKRFKPKVKSLFLISPAGFGPDINMAFIDGYCRSTQVSSLRAWMEVLVSDHGVLTDAFIRLTAAGRAQEQVAAAQRALADLAFVDGTQALSVRAILERLDVPTRIIMGLEDRIIPAQHVDDIPGFVALHRLKGVGHMPHIEARELLAGLIRNHTGSPA